MTEKEWAACDDPLAMLKWLQDNGRLTDRKGRLFAVACCRRISHLFTHKDMLASVEVAERAVEGTATQEQLRLAEELAFWAGDDASYRSMQEAAAGWAAADAARSHGQVAARGVVYEVERVYAEDEAKRREERAAQCLLLRCLFGDAPGPVLLTVDSDLIRRLARSAYDERVLPQGTLDPARLAVLADAMEEAGCTAVSLLAHLRAPGPHVGGCHALDLVLGNS
jgi:hypothetical protein